MCPRHDLRLFGKTGGQRNNRRSLIHHARYGEYDIRIIGQQQEEGWSMKVQILLNGNKIRTYLEPQRLYLDFDALRISGLFYAYRLLDRKATDADPPAPGKVDSHA
ncbi:MAG: hypothetical protein GAK35_04185 [Herbaspirillum frisingense]|uniref:Uncharacterized protein n=1 Tax=Herbaspirillum frisingense TaxID=92645 RepID=A0A7V8FSU7_9BURK|nr:MAG: hypothetical protein GAK35_04185 [Herbaspirillum frisingense]